jgi:hypothetical protein
MMNGKGTDDDLTKFSMRALVNDEMKTHSEQLIGMLAQVSIT